MTANPYRLALARARRARGFDAIPLLSFLGGALAAGLLRPEIFGFTDGLANHTSAAADAAAGLMGRIGLLLGAGLTLGTYDIVVRGPDRAVLDLHPLLPGPWYAARVTESARVRLPWLLAALGALWPLQDARAIALCATVLTGSWFAGLGVGIGVNLAAPMIGLRPRFAGMLDVIRGVNPRMQAALLYAPGTALGIAGLGILGGAGGLSASLHGGLSPLLLAPWAFGVAGLVLGSRNAASAARLPALLGEIDAAYAFADAPDEAHRVYLQWGVRFLPTGMQSHALRELRHIWRAHREWATGAWGLAALGVFAGWSGQTWVSMGLLAVVSALGVRLTQSDPAWVSEALGVPRETVRLARTVAVSAVAAPVALAAGLAACAQRGGQGVVELLALFAITGVFSATAVRSGRAYAPIAILLVGGAAALRGVYA